MNGNLVLHTDKYQILMMYAHWKNNTQDRRVVFDAFFRKMPFQNGFAVFAGLERIVEYIKGVRFDDKAIEYIRNFPENLDPAFIDYLRDFRFTGTMYAVPEGTLVFANEPLVRVDTRAIEAQLIETAILNFMNFQTLIATKAARCVMADPNSAMLEFGTRRAQEADAAVWGARAAYISGFAGTSNLYAGEKFGIPTMGTMAHAWIQDHDSEVEAFVNFGRAVPSNVSLLVDTYDTLKSGIPSTIEAARILAEEGIQVQSIRLDSGDLASLSIRGRKMLDAAGLTHIKIGASNDLDENTIMHLKMQGAKIDFWGIGTQLITAADQPSLGGVYKLVEREDKDGNMVPSIKISGNPEKVTTPGLKTVYRIIDKTDGMAQADYIAFPHEEDVRNGERIKLFDPIHTYQHQFMNHYEAIELLKPVFVNGEQVYELPTLDEIRSYHKAQKALFWPEYLRLVSPELFPVDLSQKVWDMKHDMIRKMTAKGE